MTAVGVLRRHEDLGVTTDMAVAAAESVGVCIRPLLRRVTDRRHRRIPHRAHRLRVDQGGRV